MRKIGIGAFACMFVGLLVVGVHAQEANQVWAQAVPNLFSYAKKDNTLVVTSLANGQVKIESLNPATGKSELASQVTLSKEEADSLSADSMPFRSEIKVFHSPDASLVAIIGKTGVSIRKADSFESVKSITTTVKDKTRWFFLSNQVLLRVEDKQAMLFNLANDSQKALTTANQFNPISVIEEESFSYVVLDKSILKLNNQSGDIAWESSEVSMYTSIFSNHLLVEFYQAKDYILAVTGDYEAGSKSMKNNNAFLLNPESGKLLKPAFHINMIFTNFNRGYGEAVTDLGNGRLLLSDYSSSLIDTQSGTELFSHFGFSRLAAMAGMQYLNFESSGKFKAIDVTTKKAVKSYNLGLQLASARKIGGNYWLIGSEKGKGSLLVLDESLAGIQVLKAQKIDAYADDENGALFVADGKLLWFKPDAGLVTIDASSELGKSPVLKIASSDSGTQAWLMTDSAILHYDLASQTLLNKLSWKAESWFPAKDNDIKLLKLIHNSNNLFITKNRQNNSSLLNMASMVQAVPLLAFDLGSNQLKWTCTVLNDALIAFDSAHVLVARKLNAQDKDAGFVALPYPSLP